jgi:hypothetical protein
VPHGRARHAVRIVRIMEAAETSLADDGKFVTI